MYDLIYTYNSIYYSKGIIHAKGDSKAMIYVCYLSMNSDIDYNFIWLLLVWLLCMIIVAMTV